MATKKRKESRISKKSYKERQSWEKWIGLDGEVHKRKKRTEPYLGLDGKIHRRKI